MRVGGKEGTNFETRLLFSVIKHFEFTHHTLQRIHAGIRRVSEPIS